MIKNTEAILRLAMEKSNSAMEKALKAIAELEKSGERITFYSVYTKARLSKSFVYNNPEIRKLIESYRDTNHSRALSQQDKRDTIISMQRRKIAELEKRLVSYDEIFSRIQQLQAENDELKKQLRRACDY